MIWQVLWHYLTLGRFGSHNKILLSICILFAFIQSYCDLAGMTHTPAGLPTFSTVLSSFRSSMLLWLGRGLPVAEQKILGLEFRFLSKLPSKSKILGARSEKGEKQGTNIKGFTICCRKNAVYGKKVKV